jgi:signal transduction histidine kinase
VLLNFIQENRTELIRRTREKVRSRSAPLATAEEIESGVPLFLQQFTELLAQTHLDADGKPAEPKKGASKTRTAIDSSATQHGNDLLRRGFTIAQVVHDYGDICQAVTELAGEQSKRFETNEFHLLNLCLDNAIAESVTEYARQRDRDVAARETERLGFLAHELRNLLSTATMAFHVLRSGSVAIGGSTGGVVERSLTGLRDLVDRSLAEVRLASGQHLPTRVRVAEFIEEIEVAAALDAKARGVAFRVAPVDYGIAVEADRQLLASAVSNLLQNAFKFTHPRGQVSLRAHAAKDRVLIEVEDECGGLPPGKAEELFRPFERRSPDQTGLGLGLTISRKSVGANGGEIQVKNLAGKGCIFTIDLPLAA